MGRSRGIIAVVRDLGFAVADVPPAPAELNRWQIIERTAENVPLISIWWVVGFAVVAVALLIWAFVVRPKWWLLLVVPLVLIMTLAAGGAAFNLKFRYFATVGAMLGLAPYDRGEASQITNPTGKWPRGLVVDVTIPGTTSGVGDWAAMVYLPPEYFSEPNQSFPVVYLLHGVPGITVPGLADDAGPSGMFDAAGVDEGAQAAAKAGYPVVLVAPVASPLSKDTECVDGMAGKWYTYLTVDVPSWVGAHPRFDQGAARTAIGGLSMGGYCAQMISLRNPDQYLLAANMSGANKADLPAGDDALFGSGRGAATAITYDSLHIVATEPASHSVRLWLEIGAQDDTALIAGQQQFAEAAEAAGMTVVTQVVPGGHSYEVWRPAFAKWLAWTAPQLYGQPPAPVGD